MNGRFEKGHIPYNKGMKRGSVSPDTEFKEGDVPANFKGFGTPRIVGTRREVIVTTESSYYDGKQKRRVRTTYARYLWQEAYGEIPKGHVIYNHGDREDILLESLELITRSELCKRNTRRRSISRN